MSGVSVPEVPGLDSLTSGMGGTPEESLPKWLMEDGSAWLREDGGFWLLEA